MTAGLVTVGYYLGREVGRQESVRRELDQARERGVSVEIDATSEEPETEDGSPRG